MAESPRIQFRATGLLGEALEKRADIPPGATPDETGSILSMTARRDIGRYYDMLIRSLPTFSENEALLLCDVLNGTIIESFSVPLLWTEISDAVQEGYDEKWEIDGAALVARLRALTPFECMAVGDAVERYWSGEYSRTSTESRMRLYQTGLVMKNA